MQIELDITKTIDQNASLYYDKAKKTKKKLEGIKGIIEKTQKKLDKVEKEEAVEEEKENVPQRKKVWYEKFRWFRTSDDLLVIGGRDATSNEIVIKKHTEEGDLVFHTDMAGSPFFVIKGEGKSIPEESIEEAADATCTFSRAWKLNLSTQQVFYVKPDQVSKQANPGEFLAKGAFMIRGKTQYVKNKIDLAVGATEEGAIMAGPQRAIEAHCKKFVRIEQGPAKASDTAKKLQKILGAGDLDELIRALPAGGYRVQK